MAEIWAACKNPGGTYGMLPVVKKLLERRHKVRIITNKGDTATEIILKAGLLPDAQDSAFKVLESRTGNPDVFLTTMCTGGGIGRDLVAMVDCPTVTFRDTWGAGLWNEWSETAVRRLPNHVIVNDNTDAGILLKAWSGFSTNNIRITGYPALDNCAEVDTQRTEREVREKLGLDERPIVLFAGKLAGTAVTLREICEALHALPGCYLIPRFHPRMPIERREEYRILNHVVSRLIPGTLIPWTENCTTLELTAAATVTLGECSMVQIKAAAFYKPTIAVLYENEGMKRYQDATGGQVREYPLVSLGCSAKATSHDELSNHLRAAFTGDLAKQLEARQREVFNLDGNNANRVVDFVETLLT